MKKVSIIVPCWGHRELTDQIIKGLATTEYPDFEVIIVDNGEATDPNPNPKLLKDNPNLRIVTPRRNLGFGGGNNFGAKFATGEVLVFLNNDVLIHNPNWLSTFMTEYEKNPKVVLGEHLVTDNNFTLVNHKLHPYINGWCVVIPKDLFDSLGGWDIGFGLGWFEDVWLSTQAVERGYELKEVKTGLEHMGSQTIHDGRLKPDPMMIRAGYYFRDRVIRSQIPKGRLRISVMAHGNYEFSDVSWEGKGVGGAEASLILWSREMAKLGHQVEIYGNPEKYGMQNGVMYRKIEEFRYSDYSDVFICFRNPIKEPKFVNAKTKIFWSCDQYTVGDYRKNLFPFYDKVVCISPFHKDYFIKEYQPNPDQIVVMDLGVNLDDYIGSEVVKRPGKILFCSVPYRGLDTLAELFPRIKAQVPYAELYITSDYRLWGQKDPENYQFITMFEQMEGVTFLGKVPRNELVRHQLESELMAYPSSYDENFCIAAAECMAAGAVPVVFDKGALATTVAEGGMHPRDNGEFISSVVKLLKDKELRQRYVKKGQDTVIERYDWRKLAKKWEKLLYSELEKNMMNLVARLPDSPEALDVLDLGSGEYESLVAVNVLHLPWKSYHGIDVWKPTLDKAREKHFMSKDVKFTQAEIIEALEPMVDLGVQFDVVFLFDVLEHFEKELALKVLELAQKVARQRVIIFMPLGEGTLEANDGLMEQYQNPWQKHKSMFTANELRELGYDVQELRGFHHSGKLDAAWIYKDTNYMVKCKICDAEFNSSYWLGRHKVEHTNPETKFDEDISVELAHDSVKAMPDVKLTFRKRIQVSVGDWNVDGKEAIVPYAVVADRVRIITEGYGADVIEKQEFLDK